MKKEKMFKSVLIFATFAVLIIFAKTISAKNHTIKSVFSKKIIKENNMSKTRQSVTFEMENGQTFKIELYPEFAPETVKNFVHLVSDGFYNGLTFHRVVEGFMAQGGCPVGDGSGGSENQIQGEFSSNNFTQNSLKHTRGTVSMARSSNPNSASSQFFICYDDAKFLDGNYAAFGKVTEGMEECIDQFLNIEREKNQMGEIAIPKTPIVIKKATVESL